MQENGIGQLIQALKGCKVSTSRCASWQPLTLGPDQPRHRESLEVQGVRENQLSHCQRSKAILIGDEEQSSECGQEAGDCAWTLGVHVICTLRRE